jgi:hypothetical protein
MNRGSGLSRRHEGPAAVLQAVLVLMAALALFHYASEGLSAAAGERLPAPAALHAQAR